MSTKKNLLFNSPSTFDAYFWSVYQGRHIKTIWHSHWVSVVSWLAYTQKKTLSYTYQEIPVIHGHKFWYRLRIFYCCYFPLLKITLYGTKWKRSNQTKTQIPNKAWVIVSILYFIVILMYEFTWYDKKYRCGLTGFLKEK